MADSLNQERTSRVLAPIGLRSRPDVVVHLPVGNGLVVWRDRSIAATIDCPGLPVILP